MKRHQTWDSGTIGFIRANAPLGAVCRDRAPEVNPEYFTISATGGQLSMSALHPCRNLANPDLRGIVHVAPGQLSECISLTDWPGTEVSSWSHPLNLLVAVYLAQDASEPHVPGAADDQLFQVLHAQEGAFGILVMGLSPRCASSQLWTVEDSTVS